MQCQKNGSTNDTIAKWINVCVIFRADTIRLFVYLFDCFIHVDNSFHPMIKVRVFVLLLDRGAIIFRLESCIIFQIIRKLFIIYVDRSALNLGLHEKEITKGNLINSYQSNMHLVSLCVCVCLCVPSLHSVRLRVMHEICSSQRPNENYANYRPINNHMQLQMHLIVQILSFSLFHASGHTVSIENTQFPNHTLNKYLSD